VFGWFFRSAKPIVTISDKLVVYDADRVDVVDWRETKSSKVLNEALSAIWEGRAQGYTPPPETIESVLNKFTDAGHDRPEVVFTGKKMANGRDMWHGSVNGEAVKNTCRYSCRGWFDSIDELENEVVVILKGMLSWLVVETTTITYE
jgi:hypothetical protein